jgi:CDP-glycerol glycerophosphotransferase (TagB/SpsB family)
VGRFRVERARMTVDPPRPRLGLGRRVSIRIGIAAVRVGFLLGRLRPIREHVVLATLRATEVQGNLRYVRGEMSRRRPSVPHRILAYRTRGGMRGRFVGAWHAVRAGYHLATARVFVVDDSFFPMDVISPRSGTIRIQTWHAAGAFKRIGYSVLDRSFGADEQTVKLVGIHGNYTVCVMPSETAIGHYMEAFRLPRERFTASLGVPRTDVFFDTEHRDRAGEAIRRRYGIPTGRRVVLYAPTFRGDRVLDARYDDYLDLRTMREALAPDWMLLLRLHPFVRQGVRLTPDVADFVVDVSDWPDMNELMFVADVLVTDYSSAIFEFALLQRPMAFLAPDYQAYELERGFYFDYRTGVPGPVFAETAPLAAWICAGDFDLERVGRFAAASFQVADGHASERLVDRVILPALRHEPIALD